MKPPKKLIAYHAFTDGKDEYLSTRKEAMEVIRKWRTNGEVNLRVYKIIDIEGSDEHVTETLIYSKGEFPY